MVDGEDPGAMLDGEDPGTMLDGEDPGTVLDGEDPGGAPGEALIVIASGGLVASGEAELVGVVVGALAGAETGPSDNGAETGSPDDGAEVGAAEDGAGTGAMGELPVVSMGVGFSSGSFSFSLRETAIWRPRAAP